MECEREDKIIVMLGFFEHEHLVGERAAAWYQRGLFPDTFC